MAEADIRTADDLDAALRRLFLRLQTRALPEALRRLPEQLQSPRSERVREGA